MSRPILTPAGKTVPRSVESKKPVSTIRFDLKNRLGWILLSVGLIVGGYVTAWRWWVVTTVQCQGGEAVMINLPCPQQSLLRQPMLWLDVTAPQWSPLAMIQDEQQRWWYLTGWTKKLPGTVKLQYAQSQPAYQLTQDGQNWWLVNEAGLSQTIATASADLPVTVQASWSASVATPLLTNQLIDPQLHAWILAVQTAAKVQPEPLQKISLIDQFTAELYWPAWVVIVSPDQDPAQQLNKLKPVQATLAEKAKILGKDFRRVDLRFRLPVLSGGTSLPTPTSFKPR